MRTCPVAAMAAILVVAGVLAAPAAPPALAAHARPSSHQLDRFLWGLAGQESGWNYYARNPRSGAFGRYQIMPANWAGWARTYLGRQWNDPNPLNQELVARAKVGALYRWLGSWPRVAYWWFTGDTDPNQAHWSPVARRYVANVVSLMRRAPKEAVDLPVDPASDSGLPINAGDWRLVVRQNAHLYTFPGHRPVASIPVGTAVRVTAVKVHQYRHILWLRTKLANGKAGWLSSRFSVPARPRKSPPHAPDPTPIPKPPPPGR
jgi:hypothetical protein